MHGDHTAADERGLLDAYLDEHRRMLNESVDGLTEEEARRRLVPSRTTPLGLLKHVTYVEQVWFNEAVTGTSRQELGLPADSADSFLLADEDTISSVRAAHDKACAASREAAARLSLDDVVTGSRHGPLQVRRIYLHLLRELAQHCGHADILREQLLAARR